MLVMMKNKWTPFSEIDAEEVVRLVEGNDRQKPSMVEVWGVVLWAVWGFEEWALIQRRVYGTSRRFQWRSKLRYGL